jgi:succinoglycan biosynthesis transport protein ExoP
MPPHAGSQLAQASESGFMRPLVLALAVIGALALLAVAWRGAVKMFRARVTTIEDVENSTGLVVIGAVVRRGLGAPVRAMNGHQDERADSLRQLCRTLEHNGLETSMQVLTIVPASRRRSGATFAADLARTLAARGHNVLLVQANLRQPKTQSAFRLSGFKGLAELLENDSDDPVPLLVSVAEHLMVLPAGSPEGDPMVSLSRPVLHRIVESLRSFGMIAIIDAPPAEFSGDVLPLAREADATLLVVRAGSRWTDVQEAATVTSSADVTDPAAVLVGMRR